ncbi:hypothetical protein BDR04DRAFT_1117830 [Suillus decipiens]|nr:hypothetical protein BDR04DRAFT_1117830 [Suillus decipiens]
MHAIFELVDMLMKGVSLESVDSEVLEQFERDGEWEIFSTKHDNVLCLTAGNNCPGKDDTGIMAQRQHVDSISEAECKKKWKAVRRVTATLTVRQYVEECMIQESKKASVLMYSVQSSKSLDRTCIIGCVRDTSLLLTIILDQTSSLLETLIPNHQKWTIFKHGMYDITLEQTTAILWYFLGSGWVSLAKSLVKMFLHEFASINKPQK